VLQLLVLLLGLYQSQAAMPELRPISAQILRWGRRGIGRRCAPEGRVCPPQHCHRPPTASLPCPPRLPLPQRCLYLLCQDDDRFKQDAGSTGLIRLLAQQLHHDTHWLDEPPVPAAAAASSLSAIAVAGRSPRMSGGAAPAAAPSPRGGAGGIGGGPGGAVGGGVASIGGAATPPFHEAPIPEDEELPPGAFLGSSPTHRHVASRTLSLVAPRAASEAAPLRAFGGGPTPLQRMAGAALLRAALEPVMPAPAVGVLMHGVLLPALHMKVRLDGACAGRGQARLRVERCKHSVPCTARAALAPPPPPAAPPPRPWPPRWWARG
jgi:hypothetical protein